MSWVVKAICYAFWVSNFWDSSSSLFFLDYLQFQGKFDSDGHCPCAVPLAL